MSIFTLARWLTPRRKSGHPSLAPRAVPFRPRLEALEHRALPSTLVVTNNSDTGVAGDGSLRGEIAAAASGDQIVFDPSLTGQTITLTNGSELFLNKSLTIQGLGIGQLTISGNNNRIFEIPFYATETITGLSLVNGRSSSGGAILNDGSLTLDSDTLSGNTGVLGGALMNTGTLTLSAVLLSGNAGTLGGGIYNVGTVTISS